MLSVWELVDVFVTVSPVGWKRLFQVKDEFKMPLFTAPPKDIEDSPLAAVY